MQAQATRPIVSLLARVGWWSWERGTGNNNFGLKMEWAQCKATESVGSFSHVQKTTIFSTRAFQIQNLRSPSSLKKLIRRAGGRLWQQQRPKLQSQDTKFLLSLPWVHIHDPISEFLHQLHKSKQTMYEP